MYDDEGRSPSPTSIWNSVGSDWTEPRLTPRKKKKRKKGVARDHRRQRRRGQKEEKEDGRSFRIYRRSRSNRTARGHAAAECSLQPALRMWTRLDESAIAPSQPGRELAPPILLPFRLLSRRVSPFQFLPGKRLNRGRAEGTQISLSLDANPTRVSCMYQSAASIWHRLFLRGKV